MTTATQVKATPKQVSFIRSLARAKRLNADEESKRLLGRFTDELSKSDASVLIKHLQEVK